MKRGIILLAVLLLGMLAAAQDSGFSLPKREPKVQNRTLTGQVMNKDDAPISDAIVHLRNTKTLAERTFITGSDGNYRFNALSLTQDYEVYAVKAGKQSPTKTLSQFDSRPDPKINLKIE